LKNTGIICEYNPFHKGHAKQIAAIRQERGPQEGIVCLMSGSFVQRAAPAILDKSLRAEAAILCGADLVLEMPVTHTLCSAEGFAGGSVAILSKFCQRLSFGAETADRETLLALARALISPDFPPALRTFLDAGLSFPIARQKALEKLGMDASLLSMPNNILAVEYCKAILLQGNAIEPCPIKRDGSYHAQIPDEENPSATSLRSCMREHKDISPYLPPQCVPLFENASLHSLQAGERAILAKLRTMTDAEFSLLPGGSEGLWRKLMHACREYATVEEIASAVKSKRYTRTRIDRMILCAFLGITEEMLSAPVPYVRVLAFNDRGREILKTAREFLDIPNAGESREGDYAALETRCGRLYGLFAENTPASPTIEHARRVRYIN